MVHKYVRVIKYLNNLIQAFIEQTSQNMQETQNTQENMLTTTNHFTYVCGCSRTPQETLLRNKVETDNYDQCPLHDVEKYDQSLLEPLIEVFDTEEDEVDDVIQDEDVEVTCSVCNSLFPQEGKDHCANVDCLSENVCTECAKSCSCCEKCYCDDCILYCQHCQEVVCKACCRNLNGMTYTFTFCPSCYRLNK